MSLNHVFILLARLCNRNIIIVCGFVGRNQNIASCKIIGLVWTSWSIKLICFGASPISMTSLVDIETSSTSMTGFQHQIVSWDRARYLGTWFPVQVEWVSGPAFMSRNCVSSAILICWWSLRLWLSFSELHQSLWSPSIAWLVPACFFISYSDMPAD